MVLGEVPLVIIPKNITTAVPGENVLSFDPPTNHYIKLSYLIFFPVCGTFGSPNRNIPSVDHSPRPPRETQSAAKIIFWQKSGDEYRLCLRYYNNITT